MEFVGITILHAISLSTIYPLMQDYRVSRHEDLQKMERVMGIEPTSSAWEAEVLPLNNTREALPSNYTRPDPT